MRFLTIHRKAEFEEGRFSVFRDNIVVNDADMKVLKKLYPEDRYYYEYHTVIRHVNWVTGIVGMDKISNQKI